MVWIAGGAFRMGSDNHYPEEAPAHVVRVDGFFPGRTCAPTHLSGRRRWDGSPERRRPVRHARHPPAVDKPCCVPQNPRGASAEASYDPAQPAVRIPRKVVKGGSFLCAPSYCRRYRAAAGTHS
jgi:formylglycine-generating enzyme required for sulfatase activity